MWYDRMGPRLHRMGPRWPREGKFAKFARTKQGCLREGHPIGDPRGDRGGLLGSLFRGQLLVSQILLRPYHHHKQSTRDRPLDQGWGGYPGVSLKGLSKVS